MRKNRNYIAPPSDSDSDVIDNAPNTDSLHAPAVPAEVIAERIMAENQRAQAGSTVVSPFISVGETTEVELASAQSCSAGWFITGYNTPDEADYSAPNIEITVVHVGIDHFPSRFLTKVRLEGWGRTRHGWYLGWSSGQWVKNANPLNARGGPLRVGVSVAVDRHTIPLGTRLRIPNLPAPWNTKVFVADDTGGAIVGKHIDVYCGPGSSADDEASRITSHNQTVCLD